MGGFELTRLLDPNKQGVKEFQLNLSPRIVKETRDRIFERYLPVAEKIGAEKYFRDNFEEFYKAFLGLSNVLHRLRGRLGKCIVSQSEEGLFLNT